MVQYQGGDTSYLNDLSKFPITKYNYEIKAQNNGYLNNINALMIGQIALELGAGRHTKDDIIDFSAGITINVKTNQAIKVDDVVMVLHTNKEIDESLINKGMASFNITDTKNEDFQLIKKIIE